ncbi:hypothetical protein [Peribacillus alkalitolerans]|uniref:hypothetical protein n=1 Tax=Peribacillus alkalitolerans TaxID=1550385 RepID=UPI0013D25028|nr:hypothetical protein [Peribacillus alkalitolerans]
MFLNPKKPMRSDSNLDRLMFGSKRQIEEQQVTQGGIDLDQLIAHAETLMQAYSQLKPSIQKVQPLVEGLLKKK